MFDSNRQIHQDPDSNGQIDYDAAAPGDGIDERPGWFARGGADGGDDGCCVGGGGGRSINEISLDLSDLELRRGGRGDGGMQWAAQFAQFSGSNKKFEPPPPPPRIRTPPRSPEASASLKHLFSGGNSQKLAL